MFWKYAKSTCHRSSGNALFSKYVNYTKELLRKNPMTGGDTHLPHCSYAMYSHSSNLGNASGDIDWVF
jgi:hypothetical protein